MRSGPTLAWIGVLLLVCVSSQADALTAKSRPEEDSEVGDELDDDDVDGDAEDDDLNEGRSEDVPDFITANSSFIIKAGSNITFGCQVNKLDENQLIWSVKSHLDGEGVEPKILVIGDRTISSSNVSRIEIKWYEGESEGMALTIRDAHQSDSGTYSCTLALPPPNDKMIAFHVTVLPDLQLQPHASGTSCLAPVQLILAASGIRMLVRDP